MSIRFDEKSGKFKQNEVVRFLTPKGDRIPVRLFATATTKAKLKIEWERKRQVAANQIAEENAAGPSGSKTFAEFAEEWLVTYPAAAKNRETTRIEKTYHVRVRLLPYFERLAAERGGEPYTLAEITPKVVDRLIADLSDTPKFAAGPKAQRGRVLGSPKKLAAQTVRNILQTLRKMLTSAKRWGEITTLPEVHSVKVTKTKIDFLTFDEAERLLSAITDIEDHALIACGLKAGLRAGELLGLQWSNYDAVKREIRVESQLAHEGASTREGVEGLVPVKAGMRTVPVSEALALALKKIKHLRGPFVFCDADGKTFTRFDLARKLEKWLKRAGLRRIHPHIMRHTFASHLVMRGVPIVQVQNWLGHASITMTLRYAHLAPGTGASMVNVLDQKEAAK